MRIGGRTRKERQERKGRDVGVLKGWKAQEIVGVMQQCNVENGLKGGSQEKRAGMGGGKFGPPFLPTTINCT